MAFLHSLVKLTPRPYYFEYSLNINTFPSIKKITVILALICIALNANAQTAITIYGHAYESDSKLPLPKLMVINKRTNLGIFADSEGNFSINALQTDTILLSASGFKLKKLYLNDSTDQKKYYINIPLEKLYFTLKEVSVFAPRNLSEIQKDIDKLGIKKTYTVSGIDAISSPITYLYERFSKFARSKQKVAEWENEDFKRDILKDLFRLYIQHDIIDLSEDEFDAFIKYLKLSDKFIQNASQLELTMAIKGKYESFKYRWK